MFLRPDQIPVDGSSIQVVNGQLTSVDATSDLINSPDSTSYYYFNDFIPEGPVTSSPLNWFSNADLGDASYSFDEALGILELINPGASTDWKRELLFGVSNYAASPSHRFPAGTHDLISVSTRVWSPNLVGTNLNYYFGFLSYTGGNTPNIPATSSLRGNTSYSFIGFVKSSSTSTLLCRTQSGANATEVDTGILYTASQFYRLKITVNADFSSVNFYVNGGLVSSITTDIPQDPLTPFYRLENPTVNSEAGDWGIDWVEIKVDGGVNRGAADANPTTYTVSGVVTSSDGGLPIEGAVVTTSTLNITDTTNASGEYTLTLPAGLYTLEAAADEHLNYSAPLALQVNQNMINNDFEMTAESIVSGTITSSTTSQPAISGLSLEIASLSPVVTNTSGLYTKVGVPRTGSQSVEVADSTYYNSFSGSVNANALNVTNNFSVTPKSVSVTQPQGATVLNAGGADTTIGNRIRALRTCEITQLEFIVASGTSGYVCKIYNSSGSLIATANTPTYIVAVDNLLYTAVFSTPVTLTSGQNYWIAIYRTQNFVHYLQKFTGDVDYITGNPGVTWDNSLYLTTVKSIAGDNFPGNGTNSGSQRIWIVRPFIRL